MSCIWIMCEFKTASRIEECADEVVKLARRLDVNIECSFNGCKWYVTPETKRRDLIDLFRSGKFSAQVN